MLYRPSMLGRLVAGLATAPLAAALLAGAALGAGRAGGPGSGVDGVAGSAAGAVAGSAADIPAGMLTIYRAAAATCPGLPWEVLAGIGRVETDHGRAVAVSSAGARGPMQFLPSTWAEYGVDVHGTGRPDVNDPADAVFGAARMLCADGAGTPGGVPGAVYDYNHSAAYVGAVLGWAATYARSAP